MSNLTPVGPGNDLAERHGFYSLVLTPVDHAEVAEIADALPHLGPLETDALEPLVQLVARQLFRDFAGFVDRRPRRALRLAALWRRPPTPCLARRL
jgi:hypothetical protein